MSSGGRVAVAVWGPPERNPWLSLVLRSVADHVGHPVPPPGVPGPFSLADEAVLGRALAGAGLADIEIAGLDTPARADSFDTWWARTCALAGPPVHRDSRPSRGVGRATAWPRARGSRTVRHSGRLGVARPRPARHRPTSLRRPESRRTL